MSKIYIIRHGETVWNTQHRFQGWHNSDLTDKGQKQAKLVGDFFRNKSIDQIYCSPLQRCRDTLKIIQNTSLPSDLSIKYDDRLKECNYGDIDGADERLIQTQLLLQGIDRKDPEIKFNFKFFNGESYKDQFIRILDFIDKIELQNTRLNTLIVCHMGTMKYLSIALQHKLKIEDIYEATMWRPNNNVLIIFDTVSGEVEIVEL